MKQIKNIIFDLGSVLLDIDVDRTLRSFDDLGVSGKRLEEIYKEPENFFLLFEKGAIDADTFRNAFRTLSDNHLTDQQINEAWSAMVVGFQKDKVKLLKCLVNQFDLYLLSNTNEIHVPVYTRQFRETSGGVSFEDVFTRIYYSHVVKLSKPNPAIFTYMLNDSGILPEESLFIDDLQRNVDAAIQTGFHSCHFREENDLAEVLERYGIRCNRE
jgi:FMN phosphatase YigB (HAD superfamily)